MYVELGTIFSLGASVTNDPDGIDPDHKVGVFNLGHLMFIEKFDRAFPKKRLKPINIVSVSTGNLINNLGVDEANAAFNDFFAPYDVVELDSDGKIVSTVYEQLDPLSDEKGYYCDLDKIYFTGYDAGTTFRVRYLPEPVLINDDTPDDTKIFMPRKFLPAFAKYLASMQDSIEEEANRKEFADLEFRKFFPEFSSTYRNKAPVIV